MLPISAEQTITSHFIPLNKRNKTYGLEIQVLAWDRNKNVAVYYIPSFFRIWTKTANKQNNNRYTLIFIKYSNRKHIS